MQLLIEFSLLAGIFCVYGVCLNSAAFGKWGAKNKKLY